MTDTNLSERNVHHELEVPLTHVELAERAKRAGELQALMEQRTKEFDPIKKQYKADMDAMQEELESILTACHSGKEKRLVECIERRDFTRCMVEYVYDGKVLEERTMESGERQEEMFPEAAPEAEEAAAPGEESLSEQIADDIREQTNPRTAQSAVV